MLGPLRMRRSWISPLRLLAPESQPPPVLSSVGQVPDTKVQQAFLTLSWHLRTSSHVGRIDRRRHSGLCELQHRRRIRLAALLHFNLYRVVVGRSVRGSPSETTWTSIGGKALRSVTIGDSMPAPMPLGTVTGPRFLVFALNCTGQVYRRVMGLDAGGFRCVNFCYVCVGTSEPTGPGRVSEVLQEQATARMLLPPFCGAVCDGNRCPAVARGVGASTTCFHECPVIRPFGPLSVPFPCFASMP
jgi:hypothetical protein